MQTNLGTQSNPTSATGGKSSEVLEELLREWRTNPDAESTISLCSYLSATNGDPKIVEEVGNSAVKRLADSADAMLAVGRMFLTAARWSDAERILSELAQRDGENARLLYYFGQATLLGGQAGRAEELLSKAIELGAGADAKEWLERAQSYVALERDAGRAAVANDARAEFIALLPPSRHSSGIRHVSSARPTNPAQEDTWRPASKSMKAAVPRPSSRPSQLALLKPPKPTRSQPTTAQAATPSPVKTDPAPKTEALAPKTDKPAPTSSKPQTASAKPAPVGLAKPATAQEPVSVAKPATAQEPVKAAASTTPSPAETPAPNSKAPRSVIVPVLAPETAKPQVLADKPTERVNEEVTRIMSQPALREYKRRSSIPMDEPTQVKSVPLNSEGKVPDEPTRIIKRPGDLASSVEEQIDEPTTVMQRDSAEGFSPHHAPRRILGSSPRLGEPSDEDETAIYGLGAGNEEVTVTQTAVINSTSGQAYDIDPPSSPTPSGLSFHVPKLGRVIAGQRRRRIFGRGASIGLMLAAIVGGGYAWHSHQTSAAQRALVEEQRGMEQIAALLATGRPADLAAAGTKLRATPASAAQQQRVAEYTLIHGALSALFADGDAKSVRDAEANARAAGVPAAHIAFAQIVVPLLDGKIDEAVAAVGRTADAGRDSAYHQLFAGIALERSGDSKALANYRAATSLSPDLLIAHAHAARLALLDGKSREADAALAAVDRLAHSSAEMAALSGLSWTMKHQPDGVVAAELTAAQIASLPKTLRGVPALVAASRAARSGTADAAGTSLDAALATTESPFQLWRLGMIGLDIRDRARVAAVADALAHSGSPRKAALLRARDALTHAKFKDAERFTASLGTDDAEASLIRAMIAYEKWDIGGVESALRTVRNGADSPREFGALAAAANVLTRAIDPDEAQLQSLARTDAPWAELLIVDAAMNSGRFIAAAEVMARWPAEKMTAPELLRTARLRRYQGRLDESLRATELALKTGDPTAAVVLERTYALLETGERAQAQALVSKHGSVLTSSLAPWVDALVGAYAQNPDRAAVAALTLPQGTEPLVVRILAGRVVGKLQDPRAVHYVETLQQLAPQHPDVLAARELAMQ